MAKYADASVKDIQEALREVILHEFQHHFEFRAGCRDLDIEDQQFVADAKEKL